MTNSKDSNAEDLFPVDKISAESERARELKPWHKPRKQWIRTKQWASIIESLIGKLNLADRPFKYLTLPGEDMFDVRVLHDVCERHNSRLKFLAFDSGRKTDVNISSDEVLRLPLIDKSSHLYPDRIELICHAKSIAAENARKYCGFDAINLDFCDSVGRREAGTPDTHLDALQTIVELQTNGRTEPWVLFLTTRCDRSSVTQSVRNSLAELMLRNVSDHITFNKRITAKPFELSAEKISNEKSGLASLDESGHMFTFAVGLSKWLIRLSMNAWCIQQDVTAGYRIAEDTVAPDMLSLAFRFERIQPTFVDESGLVQPRKNKPKPQTPDELSLVHMALDKYKDMIDVDWLLHHDDKLRESMIVQNAELMVHARYDFDEAVAWSRQNLWQPPNSN